MVMGVPPSIVGLYGGPQRSTGSGKHDRDRMRGTVERFRQARELRGVGRALRRTDFGAPRARGQLLSRILLDVYELIYDERKGITVIFPSTQREEDMGALFEKGILTYGAYKTFLASSLCAKESMFEKKDPRLAAQEGAKK